MAVFDAWRTVMFVGGKGTKADKSDDNGGGAVGQEWYNGLGQDCSKIMGGNGGPTSASGAWNGSQTACDVVSQSGYVRIQKTGQSYFYPNVNAGTIVNVNFAATYPDGRYKVTGVDTINGVWIDLGSLPWSADTTCDCKVGGALATHQYALDNTTGVAKDCKIWTTIHETHSSSLDWDSGGGSGTLETTHSLVGCTIIDNGVVELLNGTYVTFDAGVAPGLNGNPIMQIGDVECVEIAHIWAKDPGGTGVAGTSGEHGILLNSFGSTTKYNFVVRGCKATHCYTGLKQGATCRAVSFIDCASTAPTYAAVQLGGYAGSVIGGWFESSAARNIYVSQPAGLVHGAIIVSDNSWGVNFEGWGITVTHCVFYAQTDKAITGWTTTGGVVAIGNVFYLASPTADYAVYITGGFVFEDYNISNCDATHQLYANGTGREFTGAHSHGALSFTNTDPFVDAAGGDFTPNIGQSVCDAYLVNKGPRRWMSSDGGDEGMGYSFIGAWQPEYAGAGGGVVQLINGGLVS